MKRSIYPFHLILFFIFPVAIFSCSTKTAGTGSISELKVMSYNVHHCNPPAKEGVIDVEGIAAVIKSENPDLVALQEIDVNTGRSGNIDQAKLLAQHAGFAHSYFGKAINFDGGEYGVMILSKYPIKNTTTTPLPSDTSLKGEPRVLVETEVQLPGNRKLKFACTHLDALRNDGNRKLQAAAIIKKLSSAKTPVIVAGDLNANESSDVIKSFDEHFQKTCTSCSPTMPDSKNAIDYIYFAPKDVFEVTGHRVIQDEHSDHYPIVATLKFKD